MTRASLEMSLHLARVSKSLSNFLEDELSGSHLGLGISARAHLDRFRSFLHQYHVEKFGYWPPLEGSQFPKALYKSMYFDFRGLYDYLVDSDSTDSMDSEKLPSGGICVLQNVTAFNQRHHYQPLPHPLPLIPNASVYNKAQSQRLSMALSLKSKANRVGRNYSARSALCAAANTKDLSILDCALVKAYRTFERDTTLVKDEKVTLQDARKVRWILIYSILQVLISATRAPSDVRDTDGPEYAMCVSVHGLIPWDTGFNLKTSSTASMRPSTSVNRPSMSISRPATSSGRPSSSHSFDFNGMPLPEVISVTKSLPTTPEFEIHPDCETDNTYFGNTRSKSSPTLSTMAKQAETMAALPTPSSPVRRNSSKRSVKSVKAFSFVNFASRRNSVIVKPPQTSFCEIIVHGYGNGLNSTSSESTLKVEQQEIAELPASPVPPPETETTIEATPKSSSSDDSSSTIVPKPLRLPPLSRRSLRVPKPISGRTAEIIPEPERTPTLDVTQVEQPSDHMAIQVTHSDLQMTRSNSHTPVSASTATDSDHEDDSPIWSSRRGSASSQSSAEVSPLNVYPPKPVELPAASEPTAPPEPLARYKYQEEPVQDPGDSLPEIRDVGGLLQKTESAPNKPRPKSILVQRSFSIERLDPERAEKRVSLVLPKPQLPPPSVAAKRREQEKKLKERVAAQRKQKRMGMFQRDELHGNVDMASILKSGAALKAKA